MEIGHDSPLPPPTAEGSQETSYVPIRVLGKGAFGEAVLYRKVEDNSLVVWKEVALGNLGEKERREAQNEIEILSMLNHANIVSYYNHFLDGDTLLIEMEYANGGNLYDKIAAQESLFEEKVVLWYFYQIISALAHIHEYGILHRDIKTLNIFLTKSGLVKLGDFGISKILDYTAEMAESYVGTPYYMSPELIQGDRYNQKSDVWSAGCVLYELLTLTRVFDATNPLKLAHDIVQSDIQDIDSSFSEDVKFLVKKMLNKEPSERPTAEDIVRSPLLASVTEEFDSKIWELNFATRRAKSYSSTSSQDIQPVVTSTSSEVFVWGGGKLTPQNLDFFTQGKSALQVSAGHAHFAVVTVEKELYTWVNSHGGAGEIVGQLGHSNTSAYKAPKKVDSLEGKSVKQVSCGEDFTVCITDEGQMFAFGSDYYGCLGCDNQQGDEVYTPLLVDFFSTRAIQQVSCGDTHVLALTEEGEIFSWGCGEFGRLGLGSEDDFAVPQKVHTRGRQGIRSVHAGPDGSFLVKTNGRVLACGSNEYNKLGFNSCAQGLKRKEQLSYDIPCKYTFSTVKPLSKYNVVAIATGRTHSAVIDYLGRLITFGSNRFGQLGAGDFREHNGVHLVTGTLTGKSVIRVACGDGFTVTATNDNHIYSWGLAENGRLGTTSTEQRKGPGGSSCALPRPIFGSLHAVSDIACQHWNTILVAEKVLAQKTIRSTSVLATKELSQLEETDDEPFEFHTDFLESDNGNPSTQMSQEANESAIPDWLKEELVSSEFIAATPGASQCEDPRSQGVSSQDTVPVRVDMEDSVPPWLRSELDEAEFIPLNGDKQKSYGTDQIQIPVDESERLNIMQPDLPSQDPSDNRSISPESLSALHAKIHKLETENIKLQDLVCHQAETIRTQATTIVHLEDKTKYYQDIQEEIWDLVATWQQEWLAAMGYHDNDNNIYGDNNNKSKPMSAPPYQPSSMSSCDTEMGSQEALDCDNGKQREASQDDTNDNQNRQEVLLKWDNLGSPDETKTWSKSNKSDMLKSFRPKMMMQQLKGVTTTEETL